MTIAALSDSPAPAPESGVENPRHDARKIRALIVDDQSLEREVMRRMLAQEPDIEIIGTADDGLEAVAQIQHLKPDLVLLDVQMPELDGIGVASKLDPSWQPVIIFVTANEEFARKAFDVQALDYLIKPCGRERLKLALQRAREFIRRKEADHLNRKLSELLAREMKNGPRAPERIAVKSGGRILLVKLSELAWAEAVDNCVLLHVGPDLHSVRDSVAELESRLPAERFLRISRSAIVNVEQIVELEPMLHGEYGVILRNGTRLTLTRGYLEKLDRLGV